MLNLSKTEFSVNSFVFYPSYGVGIVECISVQKIGSADISFYNVKILENNAKIMVPLKNAHEVGLRQLIKENEIQNLTQFCTSITKQVLAVGRVATGGSVEQLSIQLSRHVLLRTDYRLQRKFKNKSKISLSSVATKLKNRLRMRKRTNRFLEEKCWCTR